jgi:hypothetical protein
MALLEIQCEVSDLLNEPGIGGRRPRPAGTTEPGQDLLAPPLDDVPDREGSRLRDAARVQRIRIDFIGRLSERRLRRPSIASIAPR